MAEILAVILLLLILFFSVSSILPSGQLSNVPWRRADVKYANNEAYFDVVEEVSSIYLSSFVNFMPFFNYAKKEKLLQIFV